MARPAAGRPAQLPSLSVSQQISQGEGSGAEIGAERGNEIDPQEWQRQYLDGPANSCKELAKRQGGTEKNQGAGPAQ